MHKQYTSTSVTALCYARTSAKIFIGTSMGELMIFDIDISKITMTIREPLGKIVGIKFFEGLKNIYMFLNNGRVRIIDSLTYETVQETAPFKKRNKIVGPETNEKQFVYMTNIDEILENPLSLLDEKKMNIMEKFSEKISKSVRVNSFERQVLNGNVCIVFGDCDFNVYNLTIKADKQFKQMVDTFRKVNKELDKDSFTARSKFIDQICNSSLEWQYCAQSEDGTLIALINEKKFLILYDIVKDKIVNHFILDLVGSLCRCTLENEGKEVYLANKDGRFVSYELLSGLKLFDIQVPLTCVIWAEKLHGLYDFCFFNNPDEVFSFP